MPPDFEAFYLRHCRAIYRVCFAFLKNASPVQGELLAVRLTEGLTEQTMPSFISPIGVAESPQGDDLYASPAGRSFCAYASSRALLHVGSLSLWDRQPSNAPPLLLSPAGLASRRGPHTKTHLGLCPKTP